MSKQKNTLCIHRNSACRLNCTLNNIFINLLSKAENHGTQNNAACSISARALGAGSCSAIIFEHWLMEEIIYFGKQSDKT